MWGSLLSSLEKAGDALTDRATAHVAHHRNQEQPDQQQQQESSIQTTGSNEDQNTEGNNNNPLQNWRERFTDEKKREELTSTLITSWKNVESFSKRAVDAARDAAERERIRLQLQLNKRNAQIGDPNLPLDVEALKDAEVVYITDRIITTSHPSLQSATDGDITPDRKLNAVAHLLQRRHGGRYMVWNMSELEYDYSVLDDQVLTYQFPGSPSPPLGLLLKLLLSIESWLKADQRNVAVLHCLTGRGRTSTVLAAFLCWTNEAGFNDPNIALEYIAHCRRTTVENLTIPSQRRYVSYFSNMLDGVRPSQPPLLLKRIIMSEAPKFGKRPPSSSTEQDNDSANSDKKSELGCAPYLQIFKAGKLVFTTAASMNYSQSKEELPFCTPTDGPISFPIETVVQGDILIRCRHLTRKGQRVSMFRAAFHTGYIPPKVLRLTKAQLDGACNDNKFKDDFFLDMIFEACDASMASKHLLSGDDPDLEIEENKTEMHNEAASRRATGTVSNESKPGQPITASAYDSMLHRDSRFWDVIAERRKKNMRLKDEGSKSSEKKSNDDNSVGLSPFSGPTIGRRRDFASMSGKFGSSDKESSSSDKSKKSSSNAPANKSSKAPSAIDAFSIGGEFDFMENDENDDDNNVSGEFVKDATASEDNAPKATIVAIPPSPTPPPKPKRDSLMEALMALDDDNNAAEEAEEIVFEANEGEEDDGDSTDKKGAEQSKEGQDATSVEKKDESESSADEKGSADASEAKSTGDTTATTTKETAEQNKDTTEVPADIVKDVLANLDLEDIEGDDVDLADGLAEDDNVDVGADGADEDVNFEDYDDDDEDLEDLENFLTKATAK
uniref:Phosphatidylinositol-3,4,5-trisphosphate 3-phosphatase n=1 Tax=Ditylum brightwellii TaxID=49249 RepID=A0A7S4V951_9STRA